MTEQAQVQSRYTGINSIALEGNLTRDAEAKEINTAKGTAKVLEARLAFNTLAAGGSTKPNYIDLAIWGEKRVDALLPILKKGTPVVVDGELSLNEGNGGENGVRRVFPQVRVDKIHTPRRTQSAAPAATEQAPSEPAPEVGGDDEKVPF